MTDLRKVAEAALAAMESGPDVDPIFAGETITALRTALALPEQEPFGWLYESKAGVRIFHFVSDNEPLVQADWEAAQQYPEAHKMTPLYTQSPQHLQSFAQDWDAPGMEAYDDPPLAPPEPTRSQQMRDAGYTRRPRQLPKEDEQEPVAWLQTENFIDPEGLWDKRKTFNCEGDGTPLYAAPPQRKPLTEEQIAQIDWKDGETLHDFARAIERAHGIGDKE